MIRRLFFAALIVTAGVLCIFVAEKAAPSIELRLAPIRTDQHMEEVHRANGRLCWTWVSVKRRPLVSDEMHVAIDVAGDRSTASIFERDTGMPWARSRAVPVGPHRQPYCVLLPPSVTATDPVRILQVADYPGFLDLWTLHVRLPDVVDPATTGSP